MRFRLAVFGIAASGLVVLGACTSTRSARNIEVVVSGESAVNGERLRSFTLESIARMAPRAHDVRVTVDFGAPAATLVRELPVGAGSEEMIGGLAARGSYSISDTAGHVLATGPFEVGASVHQWSSPDRSPLELRIALLRATAQFLAQKMGEL